MTYPAPQMTSPIPWEQQINQAWHHPLAPSNNQTHKHKLLKVKPWAIYNIQYTQKSLTSYQPAKSKPLWIYTKMYLLQLPDLTEPNPKGHVVTDGSHFEYPVLTPQLTKHFQVPNDQKVTNSH